MNIRFAFAVGSENSFESSHFGDAHRFLVYEIADENLYFVESEMNFNRVPGGDKNGDPEKSRRMIRYLKDKHINVLVSRKFGKNVEMIRKEFLPMLVQGQEPNEVTRCLSKKLDKLKKVLRNKKDVFPVIDAREW